MKVDAQDVEKAKQKANEISDHLKAHALPIDETDKIVWMLLTDVPKMSTTTAFICLFLNIILPGFGTMFAATTQEHW
eukprot:CAMPEP_0176377566 /NCGR_PEP_ID=MMETSP0126-20121128/28982_1 /TAXON_ID=141414 ORGANISM="Strombidinopsis acuminatum, Strain SPMC142" /NCGR_SAMPLE_ID=MMETSP0126 /ASSEMBLY_ACC=CAM_ASM_000229 /LENGTH=76 /DNA_ID=CAMNT_0017739463 /DNA_START=49 /DNA_END=276 /DNA_ORIENTATION=+